MYFNYSTLLPDGYLEPVRLSEAKQHLRVDFAEDDALISALIAAAREYAEQFCGRSFIEKKVITETHTAPLTTTIELRIAPVTGAVSMKYKDENSEFQPVEDIFTTTSADISVLSLKDGQSWPTAQSTFGNFVIQYEAGYSECPPSVKAAILLMVGDLYEKREDSVKTLPTAAEYLLQPFRQLKFT